MSAHTGRLGADIRRALTTEESRPASPRSGKPDPCRHEVDGSPPTRRRRTLGGGPGTRSTVQPTAPPRSHLPGPLAHPHRDRAAAHPDAVAGATGRVGG